MSSDSEESVEPITVSDLTTQVKDALYKTFKNTIQIVVGEISNFKPSRGRAFFTLKDDTSQISAIMWDYDQDKYPSIKEGKKIQVSGKITLFQKSGSYNITVYDMKQVGEGELHQEYVELQKKYSDMGYFDQSIKKTLPETINSIGVITAADGAALQDFLYALKENNFVGKVNVKGCIVQGNNCPDSVAKSIEELDKLKLDVIVITRGGGSFEDLFGFSHPKVLEALYKAKTCTISAIGHEVDHMLSDFVADIRQPTPTRAGEVLSADGFDQKEVDEVINSLISKLNNRIDRSEQQLINLQKLLKSPRDAVDKIISDIQLVEDQLVLLIKSKMSYIEGILNKSTSMVNKQEDKQNILAKGYSMLYCDGKQITNIKDLLNAIKKSKKLKILMQYGETVLKIK